MACLAIFAAHTGYCSGLPGNTSPPPAALVAEYDRFVAICKAIKPVLPGGQDGGSVASAARAYLPSSYGPAEIAARFSFFVQPRSGEAFQDSELALDDLVVAPGAPQQIADLYRDLYSRLKSADRFDEHRTSGPPLRLIQAAAKLTSLPLSAAEIQDRFEKIRVYLSAFPEFTLIPPPDSLDSFVDDQKLHLDGSTLFAVLLGLDPESFSSRYDVLRAMTLDMTAPDTTRDYLGAWNVLGAIRQFGSIQNDDPSTWGTKYLKLAELFKQKDGESYTNRLWAINIIGTPGKPEDVFAKYRQVLSLLVGEAKNHPSNDLIWGSIGSDQAAELTPQNATPAELLGLYALIAQRLAQDGYSEFKGKPMGPEVMDLLNGMEKAAPSATTR